jgi:hypothetical protein
MKNQSFPPGMRAVQRIEVLLPRPAAPPPSSAEIRQICIDYYDAIGETIVARFADGTPFYNVPGGGR